MARNIQALVPCTEEMPVVEPAELAGPRPQLSHRNLSRLR
jgi:hypothetical protein